MNTSIRTIGLSLATICAMFILMTACKKENKSGSAITPSRLSMVHASPGGAAYDMLANGARLTLRPLYYGNYTGYGAVASGRSEFTVLRRDRKTVVAKTTFDLSPFKAYSIYIADVPSSASLLLTQDDLSAPSPGKAKLRFVNLNPDAGVLDLHIPGDSSALFQKIPFKTSTDFIELSPATAIGFILRDSLAKEDLTISSKYRIDQGGIYTVVAKGLRSDTGASRLTIGMINNK
jgi:hypothetical protein